MKSIISKTEKEFNYVVMDEKENGAMVLMPCKTKRNKKSYIGGYDAILKKDFPEYNITYDRNGVYVVTPKVVENEKAA